MAGHTLLVRYCCKCQPYSRDASALVQYVRQVVFSGNLLYRPTIETIPTTLLIPDVYSAVQCLPIGVTSSCCQKSYLLIF